MSHTGECEVVARRAGKIRKLKNEKMRKLANEEMRKLENIVSLFNFGKVLNFAKV